MSGRQEELGKPLPTPTFAILASNLAAQAMIELGEIPNPITGQTERSLIRAKFTIDLLQILRDKTRGNLAAEEDQFLERSLYELRMRYVRASG